MEVHNLPIPVNPNPVPVSSRGAAFSTQQEPDNTEEQTARPVNETEQTTEEQNNPRQNIETNLQILLQQQGSQQQANGSLQDSQLNFSAQQAVDTYQDIDSHEENQADIQVLSRVDELV